MLFTIIKVGLKGRSFRNNPNNFAQEAVMETGLSLILLPVITAVIILVLLFILSFTHLLGGPYGLAKVFFWFFAIGYAVISLPVYFFYKTIKKASRIVGNKTEQIFVKSEVKE